MVSGADYQLAVLRLDRPVILVVCDVNTSCSESRSPVTGRQGLMSANTYKGVGEGWRGIHT